MRFAVWREVGGCAGLEAQRYGGGGRRSGDWAGGKTRMDTGVMLGFISRGAAELCRDQGVFYFHAVDKNRQPIDFASRILTARYIFPFSSACDTDDVDSAPTQWLDWWAEVETISMVHRTASGNTTGCSPS